MGRLRDTAGFGKCDCGNLGRKFNGSSYRCERCRLLERQAHHGNTTSGVNEAEYSAKQGHQYWYALCGLSTAELQSLNHACDQFFRKRGIEPPQMNHFYVNDYEH